MAVIKALKDRSKYETTDKNGKRIPRLKNVWKNPYCKWKTPDYSIHCKSSNRDDIIEYILNTHLVEWYTSKLLRLNADTDDECREYIQEIWMLILNVKQEKWDNIYAQGEAIITAFVSGIIIKNVISKTSRTYRNIRGWKKTNVPIPEWLSDRIDEDGNYTVPKTHYTKRDEEGTDKLS